MIKKAGLAAFLAAGMGMFLACGDDTDSTSNKTPTNNSNSTPAGDDNSSASNPQGTSNATSDAANNSDGTGSQALTSKALQEATAVTKAAFEKECKALGKDSALAKVAKKIVMFVDSSKKTDKLCTSLETACASLKDAEEQLKQAGVDLKEAHVTLLSGGSIDSGTLNKFGSKRITIGGDPKCSQ